MKVFQLLILSLILSSPQGWASSVIFYEPLTVVARPNYYQPDKVLGDYFNTPVLHHEFGRKFYEQFGQDYDRINFHRVQNNMISTHGAMGSDDHERAEVKAFGEYVVKRLTEYHTEQYMQNEPAMRPIVEAKKKIENVEVRVTPEYYLKLNYSLVGNYFQSQIYNPYVDFKLIWLMDPQKFGPSEVQSSKIYIGKSVTRKNYLEFWGDSSAAFGSRLEHRISRTTSAYSSVSTSLVNKEFGEIGMRWNY